MIIALTALLAAGCAGAPAGPTYRGVEATRLDNDLVRLHVSMTHPRAPGDIETYAECAAAQYALASGNGFARHLRTNVEEKGGVWSADAVYTISAQLPRGLETIDAEVVVQNCAENGIPTV